LHFCSLWSFYNGVFEEATLIKLNPCNYFVMAFDAFHFKPELNFFGFIE